MGAQHTAMCFEEVFCEVSFVKCFVSTVHKLFFCDKSPPDFVNTSHKGTLLVFAGREITTLP